MNATREVKPMTFEEFARTQSWVPNEMSYMKDSLGCIDYEQVFESLVDEASRDGVVITDVDTVDYAEFLHDWAEESLNG